MSVKVIESHFRLIVQQQWHQIYMLSKAEVDFSANVYNTRYW